MRRPLVAHVISTPRRRRPVRRLLIRPVRIAQDARKKAEEKEAKKAAKKARKEEVRAATRYAAR